MLKCMLIDLLLRNPTPGRYKRTAATPPGMVLCLQLRQRHHHLAQRHHHLAQRQRRCRRLHSVEVRQRQETAPAITAALVAALVLVVAVAVVEPTLIRPLGQEEGQEALPRFTRLVLITSTCLQCRPARWRDIKGTFRPRGRRSVGIHKALTALHRRQHSARTALCQLLLQQRYRKVLAVLRQRQRLQRHKAAGTDFCPRHGKLRHCKAFNRHRRRLQL
jgi:hypothetical protein